MNLLQKISKWIFSRGTLPYWCILVYDSITVIASGYFVYYLQHVTVYFSISFTKK